MENTNLIIEPHQQQESLSETQTRQRSNETTSLRPTIPPACIDAISKEPTEAIVKSSSTTVAANVRNYLLEPPLQLSELILEDNYDPLRWPEVFIAIRGLAYGTTTRALYKRFSQEGNIVSVTIHSDLRSGDGNSRRRGAIIRFCPAPADCFWRYGVLSIDIGVGRPWQVQAWLDLQRHADGRVPSPVKTGITYPELSSLTLDSIAFGFMSDAHTFVPMHTAHATEALPALVTLNLRRKYLEIQFHVQMIDTRPRETPRHGAHDRTVEYRMRIPLYQIREIYEIVHSPEHYALFLDQDTPPLFYKKSENIESTFDDKASHWNERCIWNRETDIVYDEEEMRRAPISLHRSQSIVDPGRWKAYHISFHRSDINPYTYDLIMSALEDFNVRKAPLDPFVVQKARQRSVWQWIDRPGTDQTSLKLALAGLQGIGLLPFSVRYQLEVCISQDVLNEYTLNCAFIERLFSLGEDRATILLEDVAAQGLRVYEPMSIYDINFNKYHKRTKIPHYCTPMRKAVITPTTIYYTSPTLETSNRVIRQYAQYGDRFLRVQFTDEKLEGRIHSNDGNEAEEVFRRIRQALENGLTIGDRHYEFLAFSNSQFREHGAYFISPDTNFSTTIVLDWMGQFNSIKTVARYAARLGQCFSTTRAINGTRVAIAQIEDIKRNGYNFTDGVGKISSFVAKMIASELNIHSYGVPSVFQFRLGGCKGVLALCPSARENRLYIRTSQYKSPAAHEGLEIIRWSKFAAAFLNRQLIIVLSALGVKDDIFLSKQEKMLLQLDEAMVNETTALSLLQKHVDANAMTLTLATMIQDGFMGTQEPFLRSVLQLWRAWSIKNLKERARIVVDDGAFVLGCTDETATLQGYFNSNLPRKETTLQERIDMLPQIFIQVPDPQLSGSYTVRKGPCILARNPSLHPGDIRVVNAVDVEGLHHLRDVVVLPQTGDCDLASMCSGGDLDGDDYFVSWDLDLLPEEWFHPAMNYTTTKAVTVESVTMAQVKDFFVEYMKNDKLPTIAHAHLGHADIEWDGVKSSKCLRLAELHSKAVDFAKTGQAAQMPKDLHVRYWPHFMEKRFKEKYQVYKSEKVLGQLYDGVKRVEFVPLVDAEPDSRIFEGFKRIEETMNEIRKIKVAYDTGLRRIMAQQSIGTEFEVWTTFVLKHNKQGSDYKYHEEIGQLSGALRDQYRHACIIAAGGKTPDVLEPFVAAMYVATSEEMLEAREKREEGNTTDSPLISFPWLFPEVLGKIARRGRQPTTIALKESIPASNLNAMLANPKPMFRSGKFHDDIETTEGVTHRGEVLKLFEDAKHTSNSRDAGADSDEAVTPPSIYSLESNQAILPITSSSASDLQLLSTSRWLDSLTSAPVQSRQLDDTPQALLPGKPINPFSYDAQGDRKPWLEEQTTFVSLNSVEEPKSRSQVSDVPAHMHIKVYEEHENVGSEHCSASMPVIQDSQISPFNAEDEPEFSDDQGALLSTREGNLESVGIINETAGTKSIEIVEEDLDRNRMPSEEVLQIGSS